MQVENLLYLIRIESISPSYADVINNGSAITLSPTNVNITFSESFSNSSELKAYFSNYLTGNLSVEITDIYYDSGTNKIEAIAVDIPVLESSMIMEVYIEPLVTDRIIFSTIEFNYTYYVQTVDTFLQNLTTISVEEQLEPFIYDVSPLNISSTDTLITITGVNLTTDITCTYDDTTVYSIVLTNTTYGT